VSTATAATTRPSVLVVIRDEATRALALELLAPLACAIVAENTAEAEALLRQEPFAVLILEDDQPVETGIMFLARINHQYPWLRRILVCGPLDPDLLLFLINEANVFRCLTKPVDPAALRTMITRALADHAVARTLAASAAENDRLRAELNRPGSRRRRFTAALRDGLVALPKVMLLSLLGAGWAFALGVVVLLALYALKTLLGIDLLEGLHLADLFR
jgi:CheY-like chemotaxis protein